MARPRSCCCLSCIPITNHTTNISSRSSSSSSSSHTTTRFKICMSTSDMNSNTTGSHTNRQDKSKNSTCLEYGSKMTIRKRSRNSPSSSDNSSSSSTHDNESSSLPLGQIPVRNIRHDDRMARVQSTAVLTNPLRMRPCHSIQRTSSSSSRSYWSFPSSCIRHRKGGGIILGSRAAIVLILLYALVVVLIAIPCHAEDQGPGQNDNHPYYDYDHPQYYEPNEVMDYDATTPPPTTLAPTPRPTLHPTAHPTRHPTARPTWSNEAFYEIDNDDGYTIEEEQAKIYFSSMSDVVLCLMCTFFWVLWIVGTIFPTKIQHLYRSEGVVVRGYVVESFTTTHDVQDMDMDMHMDGGGDGDGGQVPTTRERNGREGLEGMGLGMENDDDDIRMDPLRMSPKGSSDEYLEGGEDMNLPTYHAIVSYIVPGRIASGKRRRGGRLSSNDTMIHHRTRNVVTSDRYVLHRDDSKRSKRAGALEGMRQRGNTGAGVVTSTVASGKPPPASPVRFRKQQSFPPSNDSADAVVVDDRGEVDGLTSPKKVMESVTNRRKSLLDSHTFDSGNTDGTVSKWKDCDNKGYYKYNTRDDSDYECPMDDDEFEDDPEYIGNLFYHFGLIQKSKKKYEPSEPVRVKKRLETNHLLEPGQDNIEIIVLPGNPGSGILKADFEQEEDYKYGGSKETRGSHMSDLSAGMIGVALAAVSVIGAVHGALTLPYRERIYGWVLVIFSLTLMWPIAMYTYKTVNKLRIYMMNKIINLEPCGDTNNLYEGLRKLPRGRMGPCSEKGSENGNEYVLTLSAKKSGQVRRGVWNYDETSAISSLSGCEGLGLHRIV